MKNQLNILFGMENWKVTASLLVSSFAMALGAAVAGISDNPVGIILAAGSIITLVFGFMHPAKTWKPYAVLIGISLGIILFTILVMYILVLVKLERYINEGVILVFLVLAPVIFAGILGAIYRIIRRTDK
jgi:hypothetical protein